MSGLSNPPLGESDTRSKLIDPAIYARGWTEEHIRREETAGAIEIIDGKPRRRSKGRVDYTLRVKVSSGAQPVAVGVSDAKAYSIPKPLLVLFKTYLPLIEGVEATMWLEPDDNHAIRICIGSDGGRTEYRLVKTGDRYELDKPFRIEKGDVVVDFDPGQFD